MSIITIFIAKQEIIKWIENKVFENTMDSNDPDVIKREIKRLNIAIKLNSNNYKYYFIRGDLNCKINNYQDALIDFEKIHSIRDSCHDAYRLQGMIYDWIRKPDSAKIYYKKAINILEKKND